MKKIYGLQDGEIEVSFIFENGEFYIEIDTETHIHRVDVTSSEQLELMRFLFVGEQ